VVEPSSTPGIDFRYRIFNGASGDEVEHCGNGARCFARYVRDRGLATGPLIRVETQNRQLLLHIQDDGRVSVDMGAPRFAAADLPFLPEGLQAQPEGGFERWPVPVEADGPQVLEVALLSMGNPHAVMRVDDVQQAPVGLWGPALETHPRFPRRVNVGFMQVSHPGQVQLRVHERDAGETLACGTGACAAVVAGIRLGWLAEQVDVHTRGGVLTIGWPGLSEGLSAHVTMTGPAATVFEGEITL